MSSRDPFIDELVGDLTPVARPMNDFTVLALWWVASWLIVWAETLATGSLRPTALDQLETSPRFLTECLVGFFAGGLALTAVLRLSIPGARGAKHMVALAIAALAVWYGVFFYDLFDPALEPSMIGKREHCFLEGMAYSLPPLALAIFLMRRRVVLQRATGAALMGAAAASLPALAMELACMYEPVHILQFHLTPPLVLGAACALLARRLLRSV